MTNKRLESLGSLELMVLLVIVKLSKQKKLQVVLSNIRHEISIATQKTITSAAVFNCLVRLKDNKKLISVTMSSSQEIRGGKAKQIYSCTLLGEKILIEHLSRINVLMIDSGIEVDSLPDIQKKIPSLKIKNPSKSLAVELEPI